MSSIMVPPRKQSLHRQQQRSLVIKIKVPHRTALAKTVGKVSQTKKYRKPKGNDLPIKKRAYATRVQPKRTKKVAKTYKK